MVSSSVLRTSQWATTHLHAAGWLSVMLDDPEVEVAGVYQPGRKLF
ncbi:MAG: hypothetical protein OXR64_02150 [Chloroflexota bacterium]|nr:hypothetical protein [Chloroflexota bacterium]MDE2918631.1 hypothetical protein [Chloroflexota bacterium]